MATAAHATVAPMHHGKKAVEVEMQISDVRNAPLRGAHRPDSAALPVPLLPPNASAS